MAIWPFGIIWRWKDYWTKEFLWALFFGGVQTFENILEYGYDWYLETQVKNSDLRKRLRPKFKIGCKRVMIHDDYYRKGLK